MKYRTVVILGLITFLLSSTLLQIIRINDALPNLCIILCIVLTVLYSSKHGYVFAITTGLLNDLFLSKVLGVNLIIYLLIVYVVYRLSDVMFRGNFLTPIFLTLVSTLMYHVMFYIFMFFLQSTVPLSLLYGKILTEMIMNTVIALMIYRVLFRKINGYKLGDFNA